jgi:hypothetical protein
VLHSGPYLPLAHPQDHYQKAHQSTDDTCPMRKGISVAQAALSFLESNRSDSFRFMSADSERAMTTRDETRVGQEMRAEMPGMKRALLRGAMS